jgi:hypothetical protein
MQPGVKEVEKLVKLLTNTEPKWVSVVDHGANQTPFSSLKRDGSGDEDMSINKRVSAAKTAKPTAVRKLTFAKGTFADEGAVKDWLKKNDWSGDIVVTATAEGFEAAEKGVTDDAFEGIRAVKMETGVQGFVGNVKVAKNDTAATTTTDPVVEDPAEEAEAKAAKAKPAATSDDENGTNQDAGTGGEEGPATTAASAKSESGKVTTRKISWWGMYDSAEETVIDVVSDGLNNDPLPPGFDDVTQATCYAMAHAISSGKDVRAKLVSIGNEFGGIIASLFELFSGLDTDDVQKSVKSAKADPAKMLVAKAAFNEMVYSLVATKGCKDPETKDMDRGDEEAENGDRQGDTAAKADATAEALANVCKSMDSIVQALGTMSSAIGTIDKKVDGVSLKVEDATTTAIKANETASKAAAEAKAIGERAPSRKSEGTDGVEEASKSEDEKTKEIKAAKTMNLRHLIGLN